VTDRARETDRPLPGYSEETEHVRQANVEYFDLEPPVALDDIPMDWRLAERKPFMRTGARPRMPCHETSCHLEAEFSRMS
jgi:hypothetical protein